MSRLLTLLLFTCGCSLLIEAGDNSCPEGVCGGVVDAGPNGDSSPDGIYLTGVHKGASVGEADQLVLVYDSGDYPNQIMIVGAALDSGSQRFDSVTFGSAMLTRLEAFSSGDLRLEMWYLADPPAGENDLVLVASGVKPLVAGVMSFSGVDISSPFGEWMSADGQGNSVSGTVLSDTGQLVVALFGMQDFGDLGTLTVGGGFDERFDAVHGVEGLRVAGFSRGGAGSINVSATMTGEPSHGAIAASLKPAP